MSNNKIRFVGALIGTLVVSVLAVSNAFAHHNAANTYMQGKRVLWQGVVTFVSWDGPHVMYQVDVKNAEGTVESWQVLGSSPRSLAKRGIYKKTINAGDAITVSGFLTVGSQIVTPIYVAPSDGHKLFVGYVANDLAFQ